MRSDIRLIACDSGIANIIEMGSIPEVADDTPTVKAANVTAAYNALVDGRKEKRIGIQARGNGVDPFRLYSAHLEIVNIPMEKATA